MKLTNKHKCLVNLEKDYENTIQVGGKELWFDPEFDKERNSRCYGEVVAWPKGATARGSQISGIKDPTGKKAYFWYLTSNARNATEYPDGRYHTCELDQFFCVVEDGEIVMNDGWVFVEPVITTKIESTIYIPDNEEVDKNWGWVRHRGECEDIGDNLSVGDKVFFHERCADLYEIEGSRYYVMRTEDIEAIEP